VLWSIMPLVMPVLGRIVLKEPLRLIVAVSAVIAVTGSAVLVTGQESSGQGSLLGDILVFLGVSCACTNQLIARTVARTGGRPLVTTSYQVTASATLALVVLAFSGGFQVDFASLDATAIGSMLFLGVGGGIGTFLLYNFALRYMPVGRVSLFPPLVGPVGTVMAALLLGEHVSVTDGMAIAVILFAAMLPTLVAKTEYGRKTIA
jgi:drug/metabolite transporter (DMT)-like permease